MQYKEFSLDVSNRGLCLIQGEIEDSSFSTSNTSGKTTLVVHAPLWCFFGKNLKELKGNDVINDSVNKNCYVKTLVEDGGVSYSIIRYRKHKSYKNDLRLFLGDINPDELPMDSTDELTKSSIAETQAYIEELFKLDWNIVVNTSIFGQGSVKRFSEFKDTERKNLLDNILNLNIVHDLQKSASSVIKDIKKEISENTDTLTRSKASISLLTMEIDEFTIKKDTFSTSNAAKIVRLNTEIRELEAKIAEDDTSAELFKLNTLLSKINKKLKSLEKDIANAEDVTSAMYAIDNDILSKNDKLSVQRSVVSNLELSSRLVEKKQSDIDCTECGSAITEESKAQFIKSIDAKFKVEHTKLDKLTAALYEDIHEQSRLKKIYNITDDFYKEKEKYITYKENLDFKLNTIRSTNNTDTFNSIILGKKSEIEDLKVEENPYELIIKNKNKEKRTINTTIIMLGQTTEDLNNKLKIYEFWNTGFSNKGIKSLLLDSITPFLTEKTNYYLNFLTNGEIKINFNSQSTLKGSDELRDKIDVRLLKNGKEYSMAKTSGGEARRIDICISLALQSLLSLSDSTLNITIYDEIFDSLDELGRDYVLNLLKEEIKTKDSIFVISHDSNLQDQFRNIIKIKKKGGISYVC